VFCGVPSVRTRIRDDEPDADPRRAPAAFRRDPPGQASLSVERTEHLVDVGEFGLQLHHEQMAGGGMPAQLVDEAPLAVDRERNLRLHEPAVVLAEKCGEAVGEQRMAAVQQPFSVPTAPPAEQVHPDIDRRRNALDRRECHLVRAAPLQPRDRRSGHSRDLGEIPPTQAVPNTDRPNERPQLTLVHHPSLVRGTSPPLICA
jgi:hypothetical protein